MSRFRDADRDPYGDWDDAQRVSRDDDYLRGTRILGPDNQELIYTPDDTAPPSARSLRGRGRYRYDRTCVDCGDLFVARTEHSIRCVQCQAEKQDIDL